MSLLLMPKKKPPPADETTRNRVGIKNVIYRSVSKGERVTLAEAIAILRAGW